MGETVLIVEDNDENRGIFATILRHRGFAVIEAATGGLALRLARERSPALILLDLGLPDIDGFEVMSRLTEDPDLAGLRFMVVTAHSDRGLEKRALAMGARHYLTKPISLPDLADRVRDEVALGGITGFTR